MNWRGAAAILFGIMVALTLPLPASAAIWTLDPDTGALWREMTSDELAAVGWPAETGWLTKDFGDLSKFENFTDVNLAIAYDDAVHEIGFNPVDVVDQILDKIPVLPVGADPPILGEAVSDEIYRYEGDNGWFAAQSNQTDQFSSHTMYPGHEVWMWGQHPNLTLSGGEDYIYTIKMSSTVCADGGDDPIHTGAPAEGCPIVGDLIDTADDPETDETITFSMIGEVEWCESDAHADDWAMDMTNVFSEVDDSHGDTKVDPIVEWKACWVMAEGYEYDHSKDWYVHAHDDPNAETHPWAFNNVGTDAANPHGTSGGDDSYLDAKIVLNGDDKPNVYDHRGILASEEHLSEEHPDNNLLDTNITILMHLDDIQGAGGWAIQPGERNVVTDDRAHTVEAQETGHNLNGDHCDASSRENADGEIVYTLMANPGDDDCNQDDLDRYENVFSGSNVDRVDNCIDGANCFD